MCYNIIQYHDFSCDHYSIVRRQTVDCNDRNCRFSGMHKTETHDCESTCAQALLFPDQCIITGTRDVACSRCASMTNGH